MTFDAWVKENLGKGIDYDGAYGVQCVDLAKHYIKNVLGITPQSIGNAIEYYNKRHTSKYLNDNFQWIDNTPEFVPHKGDLAVFKSKSGNGHISVCTGVGTTKYFYSYDQNYPKALHEPMTKIKHSYNSFLGVLRPNKMAKTKVQYYKLANKNINSLVDALESIGEKSDYLTRSRIAKANGIEKYRGTPLQNVQMLAKLKQGKLLKI